MKKTVLKEISKLNKIPHPKSRKSAQLQRKAIRATARAKSKIGHLMKQNLLGEKFMWFKENLEAGSSVTPAKVLELVERYLGRFDEELGQIVLKHSIRGRKGRQHASREDVINMTKKNEMNEFNTCGIEMPDLLNPKQFSLLMEWNGELRYLCNFKPSRYSRVQLNNLIKKCKENEFGECRKEELDLNFSEKVEVGVQKEEEMIVEKVEGDAEEEKSEKKESEKFGKEVETDSTLLVPESRNGTPESMSMMEGKDLGSAVQVPESTIAMEIA